MCTSLYLALQKPGSLVAGSPKIVTKSGSLEQLRRIGVDYVTSSSVSFTGENNLRFVLLYLFQAWADSYCHSLRPILVTQS